MSAGSAAIDSLAVTTSLNPDAARTYEVRTFGCQMNVHDSERISGMLEGAGYTAAEEGAEPDLVVFTPAPCVTTRTSASTARSVS